MGWEVASYPIANYIADELIYRPNHEDHVLPGEGDRRVILNRPRTGKAPLAYIVFRADEVPRFD